MREKTGFRVGCAKGLRVPTRYIQLITIDHRSHMIAKGTHKLSVGR